jgi:hypothetical protein
MASLMASNGLQTKFIRTQKRAQLWLLILLTLFAYTPTTFAINFNPTSVKGIAQAYGFVLGQEYSLSRISKEFPELTVNVDLARAQFGSTFPDIKTKLETQLKKAMGETRLVGTHPILFRDMSKFTVNFV